MYPYLPKDTRKVATADRLRACQNLGLLLDKFQPWRKQGQGWNFSFKIQKQGQENMATANEARGYWLSERSSSFRDLSLLEGDHIDPNLVKSQLGRWYAMVLAHEGEYTILHTASRLIVGLGSETTLEIHIRLHHSYGYPIIPGSALKGLTRAVALHHLATTLGVPGLSLEEFWQRKPPGGDTRMATPLDRLNGLLESSHTEQGDDSSQAAEEILAELKKDSALSEDAPIRAMSLSDFAQREKVLQFRAIFGSLEQSGGVIFFDGVPAEAPTLEAEIMNAHYPDYYTGESASYPHDGQNPNLVTYLTVAAGTPFAFAVAGRPRTDEDLVGQALSYLHQGLTSVGIGAKTATGHGVFARGKPASVQQGPSEPNPPKPNPDPMPTDKKDGEGEPDDLPSGNSELANSVMDFLKRKQGGN